MSQCPRRRSWRCPERSPRRRVGSAAVALMVAPIALFGCRPQVPSMVRGSDAQRDAWLDTIGIELSRARRVGVRRTVASTGVRRRRRAWRRRTIWHSVPANCVSRRRRDSLGWTVRDRRCPRSQARSTTSSNSSSWRTSASVRPIEVIDGFDSMPRTPGRGRSRRPLPLLPRVVARRPRSAVRSGLVKQASTARGTNHLNWPMVTSEVARVRLAVPAGGSRLAERSSTRESGWRVTRPAWPRSGPRSCRLAG